MYRQVSLSPSLSLNVTPSLSPVFGPIDSPPPLSPALTPCSLDSPPHPTSAPSLHPFAASTKAIKRLPKYEKKTASSPCTPPGTFNTRTVGLDCISVDCISAFSRSLQEDDYMNTGSPNASPPSHRASKYIDGEERIWDDALRKPLDTGIGLIDLRYHRLPLVSPSFIISEQQSTTQVDTSFYW